MRRSVTQFFLLAATATVALGLGVGCEDGPSQTFNSAPSGAGGIWNGPAGGAIAIDGGTFASGATQTTTTQVGGQNANILCTAAQEKNVWVQNFTAPIEPPGLAGGLDIAGGPTGNGVLGYDPSCLSYNSCNPSSTHGTYDPTKETWTGATVEQAEALLCQAVAYAPYYGTTNTVAWGESEELGCLYNTNSRQITDLLFQYGYVGTADATSTDGKTKYSISMNNTPISMTNAGGTTQLLFNWSSEAALSAQVNAMYDAYRNTYSPTFPADPDCIAAGHCIVGNNYGQGGYIWFTPLNLTFFVNTTVGTPQANSTPTLMDLGLLKVLPFSNAAVTMKLDSIGPVALQKNVSGTSAMCQYQLGQTFQEFDTNCLEPAGATASTNAIAKSKLFGAMSHSDEAYIFDIVGVDPQFTATLGPYQVIADGQRPSPNDIAYQLTVDQEVLGVLTNDFANNVYTPPPATAITCATNADCNTTYPSCFTPSGGGSPYCTAKDWHGIGLVSLEWAQTVQEYMQTNAGVNTQLGDPACIAWLGAVIAATTTGTAPPSPPAGKVCSGLEGIVTSAPPNTVPHGTAVTLGGKSVTADMTINALGSNALNVDPTLAVGLKPGTWYAVFCTAPGDPTTGTGYSGCFGGQNGDPLGGFYFDTMEWAVQLALPFMTPATPDVKEALLNRRFFFQEWILAVIKYLESVPTTGPETATLSTIDAQTIDPNNLFFDSAGAGFDNGEYVDRINVNTDNQAPTSLQITTNLQTSVINDFQFTRYNFRGEKALYTALTGTPGDKPGYEDLLLTNILGSSILTSAYPTGTVNGYTCATDTCPGGVCNAACSGTPAPTDPTSGLPLYAPYFPVWGCTSASSCPAVQPGDGGGPTPYGASIFSIASLGAPEFGSPITVAPVAPASADANLEFEQSAYVTLPIFQNPYDQTSNQTGQISVTLPYYPLGANIGFPITIDGSRDKFYNTYSVDFTGDSFSGNMDYDYVSIAGGAPDGGVSQNFVVRAMETQNYLGLVFACAEPTPSVANATCNPANVTPNSPFACDILGVRMYENASDILNWIAAHPNATNDCQIEIKYSIYGNYADFISSLTNGVRFGLNAEYGGACVTEVTLFDPNVVAGLGQ